MIDNTPTDGIQKKPISFNNLAIGAALNVFEVSTLGQPFEVTSGSNPRLLKHKWPQRGK
jgi:hypothetical protein